MVVTVPVALRNDDHLAGCSPASRRLDGRAAPAARSLRCDACSFGLLPDRSLRPGVVGPADGRRRARRNDERRTTRHRARDPCSLSPGDGLVRSFVRSFVRPFVVDSGSSPRKPGGQRGVGTYFITLRFCSSSPSSYKTSYESSSNDRAGETERDLNFTHKSVVTYLPSLETLRQ